MQREGPADFEVELRLVLASDVAVHVLHLGLELGRVDQRGCVCLGKGLRLGHLLGLGHRGQVCPRRAGLVVL